MILLAFVELVRIITLTFMADLDAFFESTLAKTLKDNRRVSCCMELFKVVVCHETLNELNMKCKYKPNTRKRVIAKTREDVYAGYGNSFLRVY